MTVPIMCCVVYVTKDFNYYWMTLEVKSALNYYNKGCLLCFSVRENTVSGMKTNKRTMFILKQSFLVISYKKH